VNIVLIYQNQLSGGPFPIFDGTCLVYFRGCFGDFGFRDLVLSTYLQRLTKKESLEPPGPLPQVVPPTGGRPQEMLMLVLSKSK
jgi:hypothetical protein